MSKNFDLLNCVPDLKNLGSEKLICELLHVSELFFFFLLLLLYLISICANNSFKSSFKHGVGSAVAATEIFQRC